VDEMLHGSRPGAPGANEIFELSYAFIALVKMSQTHFLGAK
jgi:hypothetical protein